MTDKSRRRLRRRLSAAVLLLIGLAVAGGLAATLTPTPQVAVADESQSALLRTGKQLFDTSCVTCHGANLQGVPDRGPSLIGVGEAAVYFQVSTGRMPAMRGEAQASREAPDLRRGADRRARRVCAGQRRRPDRGPRRRTAASRRSHCWATMWPAAATCSGSTAPPATTSPARAARCRRASTPRPLDTANPQQIYTAMLTGPQNMPKFSDRQLSPDEKRDIVAYVREAADDAEPGRLRPRRLRPSAGGHGDVDYRDGRRHRRGSVDRIASMSETSDIKGTDTPGQQGVPGQPSDAELASMSREELVELGGKLDGVETVYKEPAGRLRAPRPRSGPSARSRTGFCWAAFRGWHCCWSSCSGRGSTSRRLRR